jgi:hypothetical protein
MEESLEPHDRLAVLIDADNASAANAEALLAEVARYGLPSVKRAYGDWTTPNLRGWKDTLLNLSIQPIQQFRYTQGKNATDSALIIDAMDLMHSGRFDGFCLVSSDSDFTRLAARIREHGLKVYGFGERKTPTPFVAACDRFIYVELLGAGEEQESLKRRASDARHDPALIRLLTNAVENASDDTGWANLGPVGSLIAAQAPDFDPRSYGHRKLSELVRSLEIFEMREHDAADGSHRVISLRPRPKKGARRKAK